jgi:hypothetical protein
MVVICNEWDHAVLGQADWFSEWTGLWNERAGLMPAMNSGSFAKGEYSVISRENQAK